MKEMSGAQITMAFWKSIMSTIPNFFEVMERFKNYSYYYDTVMRDLKHTDEMVAVTPPDELDQALELALQEKTIPFVKSTAETLPDDIKSSGFYVYCCRTVDYDRIYKVVQEINEKILADAEQTKEQTEEDKDTDEPEHSRDEEKPEKDDGKENDTDSEKKQEQEGRETPDELEDGSESDTKNKKKQKKTYREE